MKTIQSILLTLISIFTLAQSYCPPNGITTNPNNPINQQNPGYLNHFNWATTSSVYNYNTSCMPNTYTTNPFLSNQSELLSIINNNKPENGWEVIAYNLGYDNNNQPLQAKPDHAFLMLYNKYTGILRVLVKWCRASNYNGSVLTLKFSQGFQTNLLDMANGEKPLLANHIPNPSITTAIRFYNDYSSWGYADFKLNYDPCTCSFNDMSRIQLYTELIKNSSIQMSGTINGSITSVVDGQGTVNSQGNFWNQQQILHLKLQQLQKMCRVL